MGPTPVRPKEEFAHLQYKNIKDVSIKDVRRRGSYSVT